MTSAMNDEGRKPTEKSIVAVILAAFVLPFKTLAWVARLACGQGRWKKTLATVSLLLNVLIIAMATPVAIKLYDLISRDWKEPRQGEGSPRGLRWVPKDLAPLTFLEEDPRILAMAGVEPVESSSDYIWLASNATGKIVAGLFLEKDDNPRAYIREAYDRHERSWIVADYRSDELTHMWYADEAADWTAAVWVRDKDCDGVPDLKIDVATGKRYERANDILWQQIDNGSYVRSVGMMLTGDGGLADPPCNLSEED